MRLLLRFLRRFADFHRNLQPIIFRHLDHAFRSGAYPVMKSQQVSSVPGHHLVANHPGCIFVQIPLGWKPDQLDSVFFGVPLTHGVRTSCRTGHDLNAARKSADKARDGCRKVTVRHAFQRPAARNDDAVQIHAASLVPDAWQVAVRRRIGKHRLDVCIVESGQAAADPGHLKSELWVSARKFLESFDGQRDVIQAVGLVWGDLRRDGVTLALQALASAGNSTLALLGEQGGTGTVNALPV